ncbi:MAG: RDD family protein [Bacteroidota bacterium]
MVIVADKNLARRFWANLIDYMIIFTISIGYITTVGEPDEYGVYRLSGTPALLIPLAWILYFPVSESIFYKTLGKAALGLMIISKDGRPATFIQCLLKRINDPIELSFFGIPAVIAISFSQQRTRLGDMLAGTITVKAAVNCDFCQSTLSLTPKEAFYRKFKCPECGELNDKNNY